VVLNTGTRLGSYEIVSLLGAGGMGEVYRARDTKLDRDVAIKVLPDLFVSDPERVARFQREAKTLAALNHPHIGGIYGLEDAGGVHALVLELVDGPTLADRIAQGPIPCDDALPIARQIAEALEAAHEAGIIHRDLKPANIKLRPDGTVKVLDFGLAKTLEPASGASASVTASPTITTPAMMTGIGMILGTAAYMSPEQAKGRPADKRSDVWAFGCVFYEMLTAKRPFEGEDVSDTLAAVLRAEPDWKGLPTSLSPTVAMLVRRCLERDRRRRIGDVSTIRFLLDEQLPAASPQAAGRVAGWLSPLTLAAAAVALTVAAATLGGALSWNARPRAVPPIPSRFVVPLGEGQTFSNLGDQVVAVSPDGSKIAYTANNGLYLRSISDLEAQTVRGTDVNPRRPMFSPDGLALAYFSVEERALKRIAATGGAPVTVTALDSLNAPLGGTWSGEHIFFGQFGGPSHGIVTVPAAGGKLELVAKTNPDEFADAPQLLPDGEHLLFTVGRGTSAERWEKSQILVQSLKTGERKVVVDGGSDGRYLKTGHLLYALSGVVYAVRFDSRTLQVIGGPVPVLEGVRRALGGSTGAAQFSISDNGTLAYIPGPLSVSSALMSLAWLDRKGVVEPLKLLPGSYRDPRISPDGKRLAFGTDDGREATVWVYDLSGATSMRPLTIGGKNRYPVWSADGQRIAFQSDREGDLAIFWQPADGGGKAERLTKPEQGTAHVPESWSPDGKWLLLSATKESDSRSVGYTVASLMLSLDDRKTVPFGDVQSTQPVNAVFSPDGKWIAYTMRGPGSVSQIYVQPFPPTGAVYQITRSTVRNAHHPFWSRDGRELYYIPAAGGFAVVSITTRPTFAFSDPVSLSRGPLGFFEGGPGNTRQNDATDDGRVVTIMAGNPSQAPPGSGQAQFHIVLNWLEELKARVPAR
jgi:serine/threonine protein kinase/Tol biopolymer transport system component